MSTDRQIEANRLNAQHSTGPTTPEGRAAVRLNGLKYGLYAETLILPGEDPAEFDAMLDRLDAEHQPATPTEEIFVSQIAMASWRRLRLQRMEVAFYKNEHKNLVDMDHRWYIAQDSIGRLALIAKFDADRGSKSFLAGFRRHEGRLDRSILTSTQELRRCRADRRANDRDNDTQAQAQNQLGLVLSPPVEHPKAPPVAKIISIETVERPPAPIIPAPEPPPNAPPTQIRPSQSKNNDANMTKSRRLLAASPVVCLHTSGAFLDIAETRMIAFNSFSGRHTGDRMRGYQGAWLLIATCLFMHLPLPAQEARSTILGRITDPTGSVIVNATVEAANTDTGVRSTARTNANGDFLLPFLIPGPYSLAVEAPGFKRSVRPQIQVRVDQHITIDMALEIGQASESVQVKAETPLLDTSTTSMGQVLSSRAVLDLPLLTGNVTPMAGLSPGVLFMPTFPKDVRPFDTGSGSAIAGDGTRIGAAQFMLDGSMNNANTGFAYSPPPGVVQEVKVQTASFDASYGYMTGVTVNMSLKSGTNELHGQTYYFNQNPQFYANRFFLNRVGTPKIAYKAHRWGGNVSGPVYLPKLYDGRNKTFFMYGYEGMWTFDPVSIGFEAVPTPAQRTGDFSNLLALGTRYQIYDPYSIAPAAGGLFSRQPLAGNRIPQSQINPVGGKIAQLYDLPNLPGNIDGVNNYTNGRNSHDNFYNHIFRIDHNLSDKQRFFVRADVTRNRRVQDQRHSDTVGHLQYRYNRGAAIDHVYSVSARFFVNTRYSYTRYIDGFFPDQVGWDLAGLGFSSTFVNQIRAVNPAALRFPRIDTTGYSSLSVQSQNWNPVDAHDFGVNATKIAGEHTVRFGFGYRIYRRNSTDLGNSSGLLTFSTNWTRGPFDTSGASPMGQGMASLLYGLPTSGSFPIAANYAEQAKILASYVQDDWKVGRKLTVSLGLRYELPSPMTERFNRSVLGFDYAAASPIQSAVRASYAANPIPQVPVDRFQVLGGLTYPGVNGQPRTLWNSNTKNFMPRIGLAYSLTPTTVFRAGIGIYFEPNGVPNFDVIQTGFSQTTQMVPTLDNGQHFIATLANPFPGGLISPLGAAGGLSTNLGQSISFFNQNLRTPYMERWQFALQRSLPAGSVLEVSYAGNRGVRQRISRNLDALADPYLSVSPVRDQQTINFLSAQVPNPFYPLLPGTSLSGTTVSRSQLLLAYPQFTGVNVDTNQGYSWYHSMQTRFEKRFSAGLMSTVSWTWSKLMEARSYLNAADPLPEKVISDQDRTHRLAVTAVYELPFGKGKPVGNSWRGFGSKMVSGWQVSGIYQGQSGPPLGFGNAIFTGNLANIPIPKSQRTVDRWFNITAGFETSSAAQLGSNLQTLSTRFSGIRGDGANNWDLAIIKNTSIRESLTLQFRAEGINALNHPQFLAPNTTPSSSAFGQVTAEWSSPRTIQFALKILF